MILDIGREKFLDLKTLAMREVYFMLML